MLESLHMEISEDISGDITNFVNEWNIKDVEYLKPGVSSMEWLYVFFFYILCLKYDRCTSAVIFTILKHTTIDTRKNTLKEQSLNKSQNKTNICIKK